MSSLRTLCKRKRTLARDAALVRQCPSLAARLAQVPNRRANAAALSLEDAIAEYNDEVTDAAEKLSKQVRSVPVRAPCAPVITAGAPRLRRISTTASRR